MQANHLLLTRRYTERPVHTHDGKVIVMRDNGTPTPRDTRIFASQLGLRPCFTPVKSPQINGVSEAFVNMLKRDYVRVTPAGRSQRPRSRRRVDR